MEPTLAIASAATLDAAAAYLESRTGLTDSEDEGANDSQAEGDTLPRSAA